MMYHDFFACSQKDLNILINLPLFHFQNDSCQVPSIELVNQSIKRKFDIKLNCQKWTNQLTTHILRPVHIGCLFSESSYVQASQVYKFSLNHGKSLKLKMSSQKTILSNFKNLLKKNILRNFAFTSSSKCSLLFPTIEEVNQSIGLKFY